MIRMIATDLDGTLLNNQSELSPNTLRAVSQVMETGAKFVLASGRMYESTRPFAEQIHANAPIIVFNGAMACDWETGRPMFSRPIPPETARAVCKMAEQRGVFIQYFPERGFFYARRIPEICDEYEGRIRVRGQETGRPLSEWIEKGAMKLLALGDAEALKELRERIEGAFEGVSTMLSHPTYLEVVSCGVDKGRALEDLAEVYGISRGEIAAFGDAGNDMGMLECAGHGYAMEGGDPLVLSRARLSAPANDLDGVARVLFSLLSKNEIGG